jgi:hypothetical protein
MSINVIAGPKDNTGNAGGGNENCPTGTTQVAKFETTDSGSYKVEGSANGVVISNANLNGGSWSSTTAIDYIIVKGGSLGAQTVTVNGATSGTFSNQGLVNGGDQVPGISNVKFCAGEGDPISISCSVSACNSLLPKTNILVDPKKPSDYQSLEAAELPLANSPEIVHAVSCRVTSKGGSAVSGATVVVAVPTGATPASAITGADGVAAFNLPLSWNLGLVSIVEPYWAGPFTVDVVNQIRTATYNELPKEISYIVTATKGSENASYNSVVRLTQDDVTVERVVAIDGHDHDNVGHVKFSFYGENCTITDGEDAPPAGLRVWQPMPELISIFPRGILPGDMFSPGVHYKVVAPDQAEYILEKIDDAGKSSFEPVVQIK